MKKFIFFFFALFSLFSFSQQTDFNYQAIIKGSNGMAVSGQSVVMQFSIIYDAANGSLVYQETHTVSTSVDGLVNLVIGGGAPTGQTGDTWGAIDWGKPLFLKEEVNLGSGFVSLGVGRIYAVPVANYAVKAGAIKGIMSGAVSTTTVTATHIDATNIYASNGIFSGSASATQINGSNASFSGVVTASAFKGDGSGLTNLPSTGTPSTSIGLVEGDSFYLGQNPSSTTNNAQSNLSIGVTALDAITTGDRNIAIGHNALTSNNTGQNNVAIGYRSQEANQDGEQNVSVGIWTLLNNTGDWNTAIGMQALYANVTGNGNTAVGSAALRNNTASQNTAVGLQSMMYNTSGAANSALGYMSLEDNTTGARNTSVGAYNLDKNTTGSDNVAIGYQSMHTAETSNQNTAIGSLSMKSHTTGTLNAAIGYKSLEDNTTGNYNIAIGAQSLANNTTGNGNSAIGRAALFINTTGDDNTGSGYGALYSNTTGEENTADGSQSLYYSTTGLRNTGVGYRSLYTNTTGTNNTAVGHTADVAANNLVNATAVGYGAVVGASNSIQLGNSNVNLVKTSGVVSTTGIITSGRVTATAFSGDGSGLTNLSPSTPLTPYGTPYFDSSFTPFATAVASSVVTVGNMQFRYSQNSVNGYLEGKTISGSLDAQRYTRIITPNNTSGATAGISMHTNSRGFNNSSWDNVLFFWTGSDYSGVGSLSHYKTEEHELIIRSNSSGGSIRESYKIFITIEGGSRVFIRAQYFN
ncbi:MAG: hypothetical protein VX325_03495 [Bacteroidota bacterium]|nr:hypothetical protein [Bacteroidota bacterium]